jgi:hypothetical protein
MGTHYSSIARSNSGDSRGYVQLKKRADYEKKRRLRAALARAGYQGYVKRIGNEVVVIWS